MEGTIKKNKNININKKRGATIVNKCFIWGTKT